MPNPAESRLRHLIAYNDEPHRFNEQEVERLIEAIDTIKILDPACGSGAFPMGILHKLVYILGKLDPGNERWKAKQIAKANEIPDSTIREKVVADIEQAFEHNELDYGRKLYLIENCIYGVDIQPIATQIAKLRFFISLVVDQKIDDTQENRGIIPLPNLETKFVAANTLIGIDSQLNLRTTEVAQKEKELEDVRRRHFTARTPRTKAKYRELDAKLRAEIGELLKNYGLPSRTTAKLAFWDPYDQNASADFFNPEWMFGIKEPNNDEGFDIVIGNPPYVRQEKLENKEYFSANYESYHGMADLYTYFIEKGFDILKVSGILAFIVSNRFSHANYGEKLRNLLSKKNMMSIINFNGAEVFDSANVDTLVLVASNTAPDETKIRLAELKEKFDPSGQLNNYIEKNCFFSSKKHFGNSPWSFSSNQVLDLKHKITLKAQALKNIRDIKINRGITTGANKVFIINTAIKERLCSEDPKSLEIIKPILKGRDIDRYYYKWGGTWVIFTSRGINIEEYPAIKKYLTRHKELLEPKPSGWDDKKDGKWKGRKPGSYKWYEIQDKIAYYREFEKEKVVWTRLGNINKFAISKSGEFCLDSMSFLVSDNNKYYCAILNSKLIFFYFKLSCVIWGKDGIKWFGGSFDNLPVYEIDFSNPSERKLHKEINTLVDQILTAKRATPDADISALEHEIDQLVYRLYDLTPEEIAIVEESVSTDATIKDEININTASPTELALLDGIGNKTAELIIAGRPYRKVDDLLKVRGIGKNTLAKFRDQITVD